MNEILKYKNYIGSVEYDLTNKLFFGQILFIDDLVTYEGNTIEDLEKAFRDMVDDYLETCKEIGKESQKDKRIISFDKDGKIYFVSEQGEIQCLKRMNEEIIIDGVSSENGYFIPNPERGLTAEIAYLKQENEELKKERDILLGQLVINDGEDVTVQISQSQFEQYNKYRSALEEIRKYCKEQNLKADYTACDILTITNEVIDEQIEKLKCYLKDEKVIEILAKENKQLKKQLEFSRTHKTILDAEKIKYKQALEEIREILEFYANSWISPLHYPDLKYDNTKAKEGLKMINEVLNERYRKEIF